MDAGHSLALLRARVAVPAGTVMTPVLVRSRPAASSQAGPTPTVDEGLNFPAVREVVPSGKIHRAPPAGAPLESVGSPLTVEDVAEARRGAPLPRWWQLPHGGQRGRAFPWGSAGVPRCWALASNFHLPGDFLDPRAHGGLLLQRHRRVSEENAHGLEQGHLGGLASARPTARWLSLHVQARPGGAEPPAARRLAEPQRCPMPSGSQRAGGEGRCRRCACDPRDGMVDDDATNI